MIMELTCISCPLGCQISVCIDNGNVASMTGNSCIRGERYARQEIMDPRRTVTSTVKTEKSMSHRLPVKTVPEVPKDMIAAVMSEIHKIRIAPPVHINDVIARNIAGTGSDLVATDNLLR